MQENVKKFLKVRWLRLNLSNARLILYDTAAVNIHGITTVFCSLQ
jgi:hypothetical protein